MFSEPFSSLGDRSLPRINRVVDKLECKNPAIHEEPYDRRQYIDDGDNANDQCQKHPRNKLPDLAELSKHSARPFLESMAVMPVFAEGNGSTLTSIIARRVSTT